MATLPKVLKNFNLFINSSSYAGLVEELTLPKLTIKTQEHRAGGMDAPVELDMGMNKLECNFTLSEYEPEVLKLFGIRNGAKTRITMRGALDADDHTQVTSVVITLEGAWREVDFGNWKAGEKTSLKVAMALRFYKLEIGDAEMVKIDVDNMERVIDGEDKLESMRSALGL